jgi:type IV pilus assembly protein PilQ
MKTVVIALVVSAFSVVVQASSLQDMRFAELPGEIFEVRLGFDVIGPEPAGFTIERPARIVLDFVGVENQLQQKKFPLAFDNAKSAIVLSGNGRTRLILNLNELTPYQTYVDGNDFVVEVGSRQAGGYLEKTTQSDSSQGDAPGAGAVLAINSIDFRRGEFGEGKVIVGLSDESIDIDIEKKGGAISVSFIAAELPAGLRRSLDVTDFATPVNSIDATYDDSNAVLNIKASGEYDYLAYQADNKYVISIKPLTDRELEEKRKRFAFVGEKLSLNFQDIEVRSVLQLIADFTELNLVASDTVTGSITLRLDGVPWDQALDLVLKTKGLDKRQVGNVLMIAPAAEIAERERQELETLKQLEELAPLQTEYLRIRYASASELFKLFGAAARDDEAATNSILSERGSAIVDERTNSIILTDTADKIAEFRELVEKIDVPIRQVMIEARIVIANDNFQRELGINWAAGDGRNDDHSLLAENLFVDLGVGAPTSGIALSYLADDTFLNMELSALQSSGHGEVISQPKVITGNKQQAHIESGTEIPYQEASSSGSTSTSFKEAVLKLDVTPQITPDDRIIMDLKINQDSVGEITASNIPTIDVTELQTQVLVANGQTVVLGGIYRNTLTEGVSKVPFLGDIPYMGRLFKRDIRSEEKRELLIFITPTILSSELVQ